jgi:hypothetical protein
MSEAPPSAIDPALAAEVSDDAPDFANAEGGRRIHDWRNYVGENVAAIWATLPIEVRIAIAQDAEAMALREDWD